MLWKMSQHTFAGGRLDKELMGRQDLAAYFKGASELKNFVVRRQGGVSKRRGTNLSCSLGNLSSGARLIPLVYSKDEGYYLLLHDAKAYLLSRDGVRTSSGSWSSTLGADAIYASTGIADSILDEIDYLQSGDTVFFVHKSFAPFKIVFNHSSLSLTREAISFSSSDTTAVSPVVTSISVGSNGSESKAATCAFCATFTPTGGSESPPSKAVIVDYAQGKSADGSAWVTTTMTAKIKTSANSGKFKFYKLVCYAIISDICSSSTKNSYFWVQTDTATASVSGGYATATYSHTAVKWSGEKENANPENTDSGNIDIVSFSLSPDSWIAPSTSIGTNTNNRLVRYVATRVDSDGIEHAPGHPISVIYPIPWPSGGKITLTVKQSSAIDDTPKYFNIYKMESGTYGFVGRIDEPYKDGDRWCGQFVDDYITPDLSESTLDVADHFNSADNYPTTVALYQQRLVLAGTVNDPFTFWMSATGDLYCFDTHQNLREDDAIEASLSATEMPEINHAVMSRDLILFTNGGEWEVAPVSGNAISYKTVSAKMQSAIGSARWTKPLLIGDEIVFVDGSGENLLATRYSYTSDGYESKDLTILSRWIFANNGIRRICYKRSPDSSVVCVLGNGEIAALAYMKEHDVCAWSRHVLGGGYLAKDCASSKAISNGSTEVMLLVTNAAGTAWEAWSVRDDIPVRESPTVAEHVCMDGCVTSTESEQWTVPTGKTAVNTTTAAVYAGGATAPAGTYLVGYAFESKLVTVYPEPQGNDTIQMEIKNATEVEARVIDASSFAIGANAAPGHLRQIALAPSATSGVIALRDADVKLPIGGANTRDGRMVIVQDCPFTFNLTTLNTTYQVEMSNLNGGGGNG